MEDVDKARRAGLRSAVAALCVEQGYLSADKEAVETLTQILQSYITEVGRSARVYCELAQRLEPTLVDVQLALVDVGSRVSTLKDHSKRPLRRHLQRQLRNYPQPQPKCLQVGSKPTRPSHVPSYLPSLPDSHTYIKTPTFITPQVDYYQVREKLATQHRQSRRGLSQLLGKTRESVPVAGEVDPLGLYTIVKPLPPDGPLLIQALMPSAEDRLDPVFSDHVTQGGSDTPGPHDEDASPPPAATTDEQTLSQDTLFENPFLKPARQLRLKS